MTLSKTGKIWLILGALLAALGIGIGAFGAHGLSSKMLASIEDPNDSAAMRHVEKRLGNWETAAQYQMYHAFGLLILGLICKRTNQRVTSWIGILFLLGIFFFSGSLYALVLTEMKWLGAITPLGGVSFIVGWLWLAFSVWKEPGQEAAQ